jgi:hypothetical protein
MIDMDSLVKKYTHFASRLRKEERLLSLTQIDQEWEQTEKMILDAGLFDALETKRLQRNALRDRLRNACLSPSVLDDASKINEQFLELLLSECDLLSMAAKRKGQAAQASTPLSDADRASVQARFDRYQRTLERDTHRIMTESLCDTLDLWGSLGNPEDRPLYLAQREQVRHLYAQEFETTSPLHTPDATALYQAFAQWEHLHQPAQDLSGAGQTKGHVALAATQRPISSRSA